VVLLRSGTLLDGTVGDIRIEGTRIAAVGPPGGVEDPAGGQVHDLSGYVVLPAPAEPHAHLDKALTADRVQNPTGDLLGAVDAWMAYRPSIGVEDVLERARAAALSSLASGVTAMRSHVDVGEGIELRSLDALLALREELAGVLHLELVALVSRPVTGVAGVENRAMLRAALERGADLVGGPPNVDPDPIGCLEFCLATAAEFGRPVDLHVDETLDASKLYLAELARMVSSGFPHPVTASHCVSLGMQPPETQARVAEALAAAGISVVACPLTNLYLQGREWPTSPPRGITALRSLLAAGVTVAAGSDNVQDPFNPLGRGDPLQTAALLVAAGHLAPTEAYGLVSAAARRVMGLPSIDVVPGGSADVLAVAGGSLREVLATLTEDRFVFRAGRLVARTSVERHIAPSADHVGAAGSTAEAMAWP
jgi:cytosine deaminase